MGLVAFLVGARWFLCFSMVLQEASFEVIVQKIKATNSRKQGSRASFKVVVTEI